MEAYENSASTGGSAAFAANVQLAIPNSQAHATTRRFPMPHPIGLHPDPMLPAIVHERHRSGSARVDDRVYFAFDAGSGTTMEGSTGVPGGT
jgi:hypothetical protein